MKIYEMTDKDLASFEVWLELYLFREIDQGGIHPASAKKEIVTTLMRTYLKEV